MPRGRRPNSPYPRPSDIYDNGLAEKLRGNPGVDSGLPTPPSPEVADMIAHNREHIDALA